MNLLIPSLAVCAILLGCGGKEAQFAGTWTGSDIKIDGLPPAAQDMLKQQASRFILDLKPDRHYTMQSEAGSWSVKDDHLILSVATIAGKTPQEAKKQLDEQLKNLSPDQRALAEGVVSDEHAGTLSADGKTLSIVSGKMTVVYIKGPASSTSDSSQK